MARPLSTEARAKILAAATALLIERGIEGFTVDAVSAQSGVAKTTIYRHFASVHDLLVAALDTLVTPVPTPNTGSLRTDLLELFVQHLPVVEDPRLRKVMLGILAASASDPDLQRVQTALKQQRTEPVRTVVELAIGRGEIPPGTDIDLAIDLIEGPLFVHLVMRQLPIDEASLETLIDFSVAGLEHARTPARQR